MTIINRHSVINSLNESLIPDPHLIDGRTEQDWLSFLTDYATLINFFNTSNIIEGNWAPFLLKDPIFLTASILKTKYTALHDLYKNSCFEIQQIILRGIEVNTTYRAIDNLFDHIGHIYKIIERWTSYMLLSDEKYDLKDFVLDQVKTKFSIDFWAVQYFRQHLYTISVTGLQVGPARFQDFNSFDPIIWKESEGQSPYWEVLGTEVQEIKTGNPLNISICLTALKKVGDRLFTFFESIINHSSEEYKKLSLVKSRYPDTTLLRSFVDLLKIQQQELNNISQKHLDFYYKDILKQVPLPAGADKVFLSTELLKTNATFNLPAATLFEAGYDTQKKAILFSSQKNASLNPASIINIKTLCYTNNSNSLPTLALQDISKPDTLQKDEEGRILSWPTFGSSSSEMLSATLGIAFASPMLLLREGERKITLTLKFDSSIYPGLLLGAQYFLSTQNKWLQVELASTDPVSCPVWPSDTCTVTIIIPPAQLPIEPFLINPDGLVSEWPILKILFGRLADPIAPPRLNSLTIKVDVTDVASFKLYNDYGELNSKSPFPPFGPIPAINNNFIFGNNEILSKPLDQLVIKLKWQELPCDFQAYYQQYNDNITLQKATENIPKKDTALRRLFLSKSKKNKVADDTIPFNNTCFTIDFELLQQKSWQEFGMSKMSKTTDDNGKSKFVSYETDSKCIPRVGKDLLLFDTRYKDKCAPCVTTDSGYFAYNKNEAESKSYIPDPSIQNIPLQYNGINSSGFLKMILTGPIYGFGSGIFPNVVTNITLINASSITKKVEPLELIEPAPLPFIPKLNSFTAEYSASETYKFKNETDGYPLQCYLYSPFSKYKIYDNSGIHQTDTTSVSISIVGPSYGLASSGIPLYPSFIFSGALFIELAQLIPANTLNLYFELTRNSVENPAGNTIKYYYLTDKGWDELIILSDSTNNFQCSGIIELNIPADINNNNNLMPGKNNWISIATTGDPGSYSQTVFLKTNGFSVQRCDSSILEMNDIAYIKSNTITKPMIAIPQISKVTQPFPSFGGKVAENKVAMNKRVSSIIKTKDRIISNDDFYTLILQKYKEVYYVKVIYDALQSIINVYLVRSIQDHTDPNAFIPLASACLESEIQQYLDKKSSPFTTINVSNFELQYIRITASIVLKESFIPQFQLLHNLINQALNIYLSPWIASNHAQRVIGEPLSNSKIAGFITTLEGVASVQDVSFSVYKNDFNQSYSERSINLKASETVLFVSAMQHDIQIQSIK